LAAVTALFAIPAGTAAASPVAAPAMALGPGSVPMELVQRATIAGGDVSTTWRADGVQMTAAGPAGSRVSVRKASGNSVEGWVDPPAGTAAMTPAQYAESGRSVYWDALAAGISQAEAVKVTLAMGDRLPTAAHVSAVPRVLTANIFHSVCFTVHGGYQNLIYGHACLQQSFLQRQPGQWYIENQVQTSGSSTLFPQQPLTQLEGWYCYCANGYKYTRVGWSPSATISRGSPTTYTLTASGAGFSASVQETQYPDTLSPAFPSGVEQPAFGSVWKGRNGNSRGVYGPGNNIVDDANSVAIVHNGPGSPSNAAVHVEIWWITT
jgi:hypothetical protein